MSNSPNIPDLVADIYNAYPLKARKRLMEIRELVFEAANEHNVGPLTETLKWGEPAYLTEVTKSGSTIRLAWKKSRPCHVTVFFNCKTTLMGDFGEMFPDDFEYEGHRGLHIAIASPYSKEKLSCCLMRALTYHLS